MTKNKIFKLLAWMMLLFSGTASFQSVYGATLKHIPYRLSYVRPAEEAVKVRDTQLSINLEFKSSSFVLDPAHGSNFLELRRVDSLMTAILNNPSIVLHEVNIKGYASPEGMYQINEQLSKERAASVKNYLITNYPSVAKNKYQVSFGGENWEGLYNMVLNSNTPDKMRVLKIIEEVDILKGREIQLMLLSGGDPYRYILKHFFPELRKVDLNFIYNVRNFNQAEAAEAYKLSPGALSLAEIYDLASRHLQDSEEFRSMMLSSAALFPRNDVANLNAAIASTLNGDHLAAADYLSRANQMQSGDYYNVLGVNQALSGKTDEAITSLEKGVLEKSSDAEYNLLLLRTPETIMEMVRDTVYIRDTIYRETIRTVKPQPLPLENDSPQWALKTNLIYWLALQPNIEAEVYFARRWSLNLEYQVAWWSKPVKHQYYQYMHIGVEGRYWFKRNGSFSGHHLGLYAGGGYYDLSPGRKSNGYEGYQGEFAIAAGLSYGYAWKLNKSLWMEAGIGAGYVMTEYRRYQYMDECYVYQSTERLRFFGPTKLKLTLIWRPKFKSKK